MTPSQIQNVLENWPLPNDVSATLINLSENHTYRVDDLHQNHWILRVHRADYNSAGAIDSELEWMAALGRDAGVRTPKPIAGRNQEFVQTINAWESTRFAVLFEFETGREPQQHDDLTSSFEQIGNLAAKCHTHAQTYAPSDGFDRLSWTDHGILTESGHWGDWRNSPGVTEPVRQVLTQLCNKLNTNLSGYGKHADRFGLIHADMRLANLLVDAGEVKLIDFDDCGFGWFGYDFAAAISFMETSAEVPNLMAAWLRGYRQRRAFSGQDKIMLYAMILLRRMALLAWIGSHSETDLAKSLADSFAAETAALAKNYLENEGVVKYERQILR